MQVVLRWTIQSGVVAIPRSGNAEHIAENADCIEWSLSDEDMEEVHELVRRHSDYTQSAVAWRILSGWKQLSVHFRKVMPTDYRRVLARRKAEREAAQV